MSRFQDFDYGAAVNPIEEVDEFGKLLYGNQSAATNETLAIHTTNEVASLTDLSDKQEILLILFQIFSATLSLIGSSVIVFKILRNIRRTNSSTPYDRIILLLSSCDILSSITYALAPFLLPSNTSKRVWAFGNDRSCTWLGFLAQSACFWAIWYNCILSFYYLLTVRFQVKREDFQKKYEMWMHLSGAIFFPLTSLVGLIGNWYSEMRFAMMCWIGEVPKGCQNCYGVPIAYTFGALPTIVTLISVVTNNVIIYIFVRKNLSSPRTTESGPSDIESSPRRLSTQQQLRKEVAIQGFLYVSTFLLTFLPAFAIQVLEGMVPIGEENLQQMYPLLVLNSILMPLQGFFNVFIYVRPSYNRFRDANPEERMIVVLKKALFDPNIPRISTPNAPTEKVATSDKYAEMKKRNGSNFTNSLDNIREESCAMEEKEDPNSDFTTPHSAESTESFKIHHPKHPL